LAVIPVLLVVALVSHLAGAQVSSNTNYRPTSQLEVDLRLSGTPIPLGRIFSPDGGVFTNESTQTKFANTGVRLKGKVLLLKFDIAGRLLPVIDGDGGVTALPERVNTGVPFVAGERVITTMSNANGDLAWLPDAYAADAGVNVWELQ
jgi:hypothetical protein